MRDPRGELQCPRCGSNNLTYKNVFDYYKCNECRFTFITPVYSYGEKVTPGLDSAKDVASKIFGESKRIKPEVEQAKPVARVRKERRNDNLSWLIVHFLVCVLALVCIVVWLLFDNQIADFFKGLL